MNLSGDNIELSMIIPTYNETQNIQILVPQLFLSFKELPTSIEVIIVDDDSGDGTSEVVKALQKKYNNLKLFIRRFNVLNSSNNLTTNYRVYK